MKLYIDDVDIEKIKKTWSYYPFAGVTSNPTILSKYGKMPFDVLCEIREFIGSDSKLMAQVVSVKAEEMVKEAYVIIGQLGKNSTYVKIPANAEGIKAVKILKEQEPEILVCATAVYTVGQGFLAAQAGADYVAPYVNRIDNLGGDGIQVAKDIHHICRIYGLPCQILAASFKTTRQVIELAKCGIGAATINFDVWESFHKNEIVDGAVAAFNRDFEALVGENKTFLDYK